MRVLKSVLLFLAVTLGLSAQTRNWNGGSGLWSVAANWDNGVPSSAGLAAVINSVGDTITLDSSLAFASIDSLNLTGILNINGSTLQLAPPSTAVAPLTLGAGTALNLIDSSPTASVLDLVINGNGNTYTANADPTASINADGASVISISSNGLGNTLALTGGGTLNLTNGASITADPSSGSTFSTNFNIYGDGSIGNMGLQFDGTVQAQGLGLTIAPTGGAIVNGTLQAVNAPLTLDASFGAFTNNGTIATGGANITLEALANNVTNAPSLINNAAVNVDSGDRFRVNAPGDLSPVVIQNVGVISLNASDAAGLTTTFEVNGDLATFTLNGTGTLQMSDSAFNEVDGRVGSETLLNGAGHTIQGAGTVWALNLVNNGTINGGGVNNALVISANPVDFNVNGVGFTNKGAVNVSNAGLVIDTTFGQFQNTASGVVTINAGSQATFGSAGLGGVIQNDAQISNAGTLAFDSYSGTFHLNGSGTLSSTGKILGQTGSELLVNGAGHTINAAGELQIALQNEGALNVNGGDLLVRRDLANTSTGTIGVTTGSFQILDGGGLHNDGTMTFSNGGVLVVSSSSDLTLTNNGAVNLGAAGGMFLQGGGSPVAYTLAGTGTLHLDDNSVGIGAIAGNVTLNIGNGQTLNGGGGIGTFGGGTLTLHNEGSIVANGGIPLTIASLNNYDPGTGTLSGGSYTSVAPLIIQNLGDITKIAAGTSVTLDGPNSIIGPNATTDSLTHLAQNDGTFVLTGGRSMTLLGGGTFTNNGLLQVDAGSTFDATARQFQSLDATGTLTGSYNVGGTLAYTPQAGSDGFVRTISAGAAVTLDGPGSLITFDGSTDALSQLSTNQGSLTLTNGRSLTLSNIAMYSNPGTLTLGVGSVLDTRAGTFAQLSGGTLTAGTYNLAGTFAYTPSGVNGDITTIANGASVTLSGAGQMVWGPAGNDALTHLSDNEGTFALTNGKSMALDSSVATFTNNGTLAVGAGSSFNTNNAAFQNVDAAGNLTGNYNIGGTFQYAPQAGATGAITSIDSSASLTLSGAGQMLYGGGAGTNALTTLGSNNGSFTLTGGANLAVAGAFSNNGSMLVDGGSSFNAAGAFTNNAVGSQALTISGAGSSVTALGYSGARGSNLVVGNGAVADFRGGDFTNIDPNGTLINGNFEIGGTLRFDGPTSNIQVIDSTASLTLSGSGSVLYGAGAGTNALTQLLGNDGTFAMKNGANLDLTGNGFFFNGNPSSPSGVLSLSGAGTTLSVDFFANAGAVTIDSGANMLASNGVLNFGGSITVDGPLSKLSAGGLDMSPGSTLTLLNGATGDFRSGYIANFGQGTDTFGNLFGGMLTDGTYVIGGKFLFDASSDPSGGNIEALDTGTSLTLKGQGKMLYGAADGVDALEHFQENFGSLAVIEGATLHTVEDVGNCSCANLLVGTGGLFQTDGMFFNDGAVTVGAGATLTAGAGYVQEDGVTQVDGTINSDTTVTGGVLKGTGTVGNLTVTGGIVAPGDSPGILTVVGDYFQGSEGELDILFEGRLLPGLDWSILSVTGTADLSGLVNVVGGSGVNFQLGDIFAILYAGNVIDDGVTFQFFSPGNGLMFVPVFKQGELDLQVAAAATPEPGTWLMLGAGLLAVGFAGRRRRAN